MANNEKLQKPQKPLGQRLLPLLPHIAQHIVAVREGSGWRAWSLTEKDTDPGRLCLVASAEEHATSDAELTTQNTRSSNGS
jgi:hypothetical protein